jgi:hypothetical protein
VASNDRIVCVNFKSVIPEDLQQYCLAQTQLLVEEQLATMTHQRGRGEGSYYIFGYHANMQPFAIPYSHSQSPAFLSWINHMAPLFTLLRELTKKNFPKMDLLKNNSLIDNPLAPFTAGQINWKTCVKKHIDSSDCPNSLGCLITLGDYSGGELFLHNFGIRISIQPSDVLFFETSQIEHSVLPVTDGSRTSIALYYDKRTILSQ